MARTAVAYSDLTVNSTLADPAGTSVSSGAGNGAQIPATTGGGSYPEQTVIRVVATTAGTATLLAGVKPLAESSGQGTTVLTLGTNGVGWFGPIESARFLQNDGSLIVETTQTMTVTAFRVRRH